MSIRRVVKGPGADCLGLLRGVWRELHGHEPELPGAYTPDLGRKPMGWSGFCQRRGGI